MIVLTSNGLSSQQLINAMKTRINAGKAALVVTADNKFKEKNHHVERLTKELTMLGLQVECFDLDCQSPTELMPYDVMELIGGNPYYLLHSIRKNGFRDILVHFAKNKCVIGCSAGTLVLTPTLNLIDQYSPEMNIVDLQDLSACHITDVQILPHYSKFEKRYTGFEETCLQYEADHDCQVIRLNDGEGLIEENGQISIIK